jgi:hypothetical protein
MFAYCQANIKPISLFYLKKYFSRALSLDPAAGIYSEQQFWVNIYPNNLKTLVLASSFLQENTVPRSR